MTLESEVPGPGVERADGRQVDERVAEPNLARRCHRVKRSNSNLPRSLDVILVRPEQTLGGSCSRHRVESSSFPHCIGLMVALVWASCVARSLCLEGWSCGSAPKGRRTLGTGPDETSRQTPRFPLTFLPSQASPKTRHAGGVFTDAKNRPISESQI